MAEIPVERKTSGGGLPWWLIPLLLALLLIPLFFLLRGCNTTPVATNINTNANANRALATTTNTNTVTATNTTATVNPNTVAAANANTGGDTGAAITDTSFFSGVNNKETLVGRRANFANARVERVLSDHVFVVRSGSGDMFVYLDESQDTSAGKEKSVKVKPGQELNLTGDFRRVPSTEVKAEATDKKDGALSGKEFAEMKGQQVYLHARVNNESQAK